MKKRSKKPALTVLEQRALAELLREQGTRLGTKKSENRGWTDTPLFNDQDKQTKLF